MNQDRQPNPNWPKFKQGQTIGMRGQPEILTEGYEVRTSAKNLDAIGSTQLPDELLDLQPGSNVRVVGRREGKFAVTASDKGDPVVLVNKTLVQKCGFNEDDFNWEPLES